MSIVSDTNLTIRDRFTAELTESPYDAGLYLERARCYRELSYPDLAASDAYKALMLSDEILDESGEYHEKAVEAIGNSSIRLPTNDVIEQLDVRSCEENAVDGSQQDLAKEGTTAAQKRHSWLIAVTKRQSGQAYEILAQSLIECGDLRSAWNFANRACKALPYDTKIQGIREKIVNKYAQQRNDPWDAQCLRPQTDLPHNGLVRREIYPWNSFEAERFSLSSLSYLNVEVVKVAPKLEVRSVYLPLLDLGTEARSSFPNGHKPTEPVMLRQLGLFAISDISAGEQILHEPSILTANNRLHDPLCDACSAPLPPSTTSSPLPSCPSCDDIVFCSASCFDRAQRLYHPAVCGLSDFDTSTRDPSPVAATNALYLLLLARTIAMAETQEIHPLNLREIKYLWGEFNPLSPHPASSPTSLPFSFETNIATPIHLLESLDLDIFAPATLDRYDTWVINTLLAKFRGVASAKMNPRTGMPEVCAVHWRWCLANHSCAPNVRWEWPAAAEPAGLDVGAEENGGEREDGGGCMAFFARGEEDVVQWGPEGVGKRLGGIKKGEEVMSHYCDVGLPVEARREWAAGALGGVCVCERCVWEAGAAPIVANDDVGAGESG